MVPHQRHEKVPAYVSQTNLYFGGHAFLSVEPLPHGVVLCNPAVRQLVDGHALKFPATTNGYRRQERAPHVQYHQGAHGIFRAQASDWRG